MLNKELAWGPALALCRLHSPSTWIFICPKWLLEAKQHKQKQQHQAIGSGATRACANWIWRAQCRNLNVCLCFCKQGSRPVKAPRAILVIIVCNQNGEGSLGGHPPQAEGLKLKTGIGLRTGCIMHRSSWWGKSVSEEITNRPLYQHNGLVDFIWPRKTVAEQVFAQCCSNCTLWACLKTDHVRIGSHVRALNSLTNNN